MPTSQTMHLTSSYLAKQKIKLALTMERQLANNRQWLKYKISLNHPAYQTLDTLKVAMSSASNKLPVKV